jgi:DNA-binding MarR family transcriptional regulator
VPVAPAPSTCVCTALRTASRLVTRSYDHALAPLGLRVNDYAILARLEQEGPLPLGALAGRLGMDRTTLSRETAPLTAAGLLEIRLDGRDRRLRVLALTGTGVARVRDAAPLWAEAQRTVSEQFGSERTGALVAELHALVGAAAA